VRTNYLTPTHPEPVDGCSLYVINYKFIQPFIQPFYSNSIQSDHIEKGQQQIEGSTGTSFVPMSAMPCLCSSTITATPPKRDITLKALGIYRNIPFNPMYPLPVQHQHCNTTQQI
jgi:hypothetical protein